MTLMKTKLVALSSICALAALGHAVICETFSDADCTKPRPAGLGGENVGTDQQTGMIICKVTKMYMPTKNELVAAMMTGQADGEMSFPEAGVPAEVDFRGGALRLPASARIGHFWNRAKNAYMPVVWEANSAGERGGRQIRFLVPYSLKKYSVNKGRATADQSAVLVTLLLGGLAIVPGARRRFAGGQGPEAQAAHSLKD